MKKLILPLLFLISFNLLSLRAAHAEPAAAGIIPPLQYPEQKESVHGLRFSPGYGRHKKLKGLDVGLIGNITDSEFYGVSFAGGFNRTDGKAYVGLAQWALGANVNNGKLRLVGVQMSMANFNHGDAKIYGWQFGGFGNWGKKQKIYGFQTGLINEADTVYGLQIGLLNKTKNLRGVQIGLLNMSSNGGLPFFPLINAGF